MKKFFRILMIILIIILIIVLCVFTFGTATTMAAAAAQVFSTIGFTSVTATSFVAANFVAITVAGIMLCYNLSQGDKNVDATFNPADSGGTLINSYSGSVSNKSGLNDPLSDDRTSSNRVGDYTYKKPIYDGNGNIIGYTNKPVYTTTDASDNPDIMNIAMVLLGVILFVHIISK